MTDYLEELLDNVGALLEEVRRTEGRRVVPLGDEGTGDGGFLPDAVRQSDVLEEQGGEAAEGPSWERDVPEREEKAAEVPLLGQLERMERAVQLAERAGAAEQRAGPVGAGGRGERFPVSLSGPGGGRTSFGEVSGDGSVWTGGLTAEAAVGTAETDWAERADRVFRRDSRRYDGGFYLY